MDLSTYFPAHAANPAVLLELQDYLKDLDVLAKKEVSIQFNNKGRDHAVLVMSKIFECSFDQIKIFAGDFNGRISDNKLYLESLEGFLTKGPATSLSVVFETQPNKNSEALKLLRKVKSGPSDKKISLKVASPKQITEYKKYFRTGEKMVHFTVGNDIEKGFNKYRCETDTEKFTAILNFDDPKFCGTLLNMYAILEKDAEDLN